MTLRHIKIFVTVCEQNSITKAAEKLYITQPAVSYAIKELEEYYGIKLFDRISKRLYLTEAGKKFLDYAIHIVALFDEMESNVQHWGNAGKLRIGSSITIGSHLMPLYVRSFHENYPQTDIAVYIGSSDTIEKKVLLNELDFAFIEGIVHSDSIVSEAYMDDRLAVICNPSNSVYDGKLITIERFLGQPLLLREKGSGTRELVDNILESLGYSVKPSWESTSTVALINGVINGIGISVLPYLLVKDKLEEGTLVELRVQNLRFSRKFNIIYHKNKFLIPQAKEFIEMCRHFKLKE